MISLIFLSLFILLSLHMQPAMHFMGAWNLIAMKWPFIQSCLMLLHHILCFIYYSVWRTNFTIIRRWSEWSSAASSGLGGTEVTWDTGLWERWLSGDAQTRDVNCHKHRMWCRKLSPGVTSLCSALRGPADTKRVTQQRALCAPRARVKDIASDTRTGISWAQGPHTSTQQNTENLYTWHVPVHHCPKSDDVSRDSDSWSVKFASFHP